MTNFILTYDERSKHHDYRPLYSLLGSWNAAHLQNSVWLAVLDGSAQEVRDDMQAHMHSDDTIAVIELPPEGFDWAVLNTRPEGSRWLRTHSP